MKENSKFLDLFKVEKPIIGMIHLKGDSEQSIINLAQKEIDILINNGINAVLIENYFNRNPYFVEKVLDYLATSRQNIIYGVNVLGNYELAFDLANKYNANFIQVDSVAGHLEPFYDMIFHNKINQLRQNSKAFLLGGVRFKYQPYRSGRTLEQDLEIGMNRCDAIVVTGEGTGLETDLQKIKKFREVIANFPLIVGAGLSADNCIDQLNIADAAIVGSYLKENHMDYGDVNPDNVQTLVSKVKTLRR